MKIETASPGLWPALRKTISQPQASRTQVVAPPMQRDQLHRTLATAKPAVAIRFSEGFVKNTGGQFTIDGKPFKYVGCNMYSLAWEKSETTDKMLQDAAKEGFTVVRFWADKRTTPAKMQEILDACAKYGLKVIPVLANHWALKPAENPNDQWYREGYKKEYLPAAETMARMFKDRPEVMLWELINEPETHTFENIQSFTQDVSTRLKALDPNHMVSIGTIGGVVDRFGSQISRVSTANYKKLSAIPTLDALSIHDYSYDATILERLDLNARNHGKPDVAKKFGYLDGIVSYMGRKVDNFALKHFDTMLFKPWTMRGLWRHNNQKDLQIAKDLGKPLYVGEVGFKKMHGDDRKKLLELDMQDYFNKGAQGYMLWSFEAQGRSIDGHDYGFTPKDGFGPLIQKWNQQFQQELKP